MRAGLFGADGCPASGERAVYAVNEPDRITGDRFQGTEHALPETQRANLHRPRQPPAGSAADRPRAARVLAVREAPDEPGLYYGSSQFVQVGERAFFMERLGWGPQNLSTADLAALTPHHLQALAKAEATIGSIAPEAIAAARPPGVASGMDETTIQAAEAPIGTNDELETAARLFLSHFTKGARHFPQSAAARLASRASVAARRALDMDYGATLTKSSALGPFTGYTTRAITSDGLDGQQILIVKVFGKEQQEAAVTPTDGRDGGQATVDLAARMRAMWS